MFVLHNIDLFLTNTLNYLLPHNAFFDLFFSFFSMRGNSIFVWIVIMMILILFEEKHDQKFILYFFIAFFATAILVQFALKNIVQRPRPVLTDFNRFQLIPIKSGLIPTISCPKSYSFPSGHAATAFAAAVIFSAFDKKRKKWYYLIASLIGLSRIYLYCHYVLDVIVGGGVGYTISRILLLKSHQTRRGTSPSRRKNQ